MSAWRRFPTKTACGLMLLSLGLSACGRGQSASPPTQRSEAQATRPAEVPPAPADPDETARTIARWYVRESGESPPFNPLRSASVVTDTATLYFDDFNYERVNRTICGALLAEDFPAIEHVKVVEGRAQLRRIGAECP